MTKSIPRSAYEAPESSGRTPSLLWLVPPLGTTVLDALGRRWVRSLPPVGPDYRHGYWLNLDNDQDDPESWIKVAGNYGPVTVVDD